MQYRDLEQVYLKWMHLHDPDILRLVYASIVAHQYQGNPIWLLIIGPASCGKTEILSSLEQYDGIYLVSALTKAGLASGWGDGMNSLCHQANGKVLVLKDFSATTEMHSELRNELFGALREIYDGRYVRKTGRIEIDWRGKISMLAGATPAIESQRKLDAALGERFVTVRINVPSNSDIDSMLDKDAGSTVRKEAMRQELGKAAKEFLTNLPTPVPNIYRSTLALIREAAKSIVKLRTSVVRNPYSKEIEYPLEVGEMPMRLSGQLSLLALGLVNLDLNEHEVNATILRLMRDGIPYTRIKVAEAIHKGQTGLQNIAKYTKLSQGTVSRIVEELLYLDVIDNSGRSYSIIDQALITTLNAQTQQQSGATP